jgi:hypothetical protein
MHRTSKVVAEMKAADLLLRPNYGSVSATYVLLSADFDTGGAWGATETLPVRFQDGMCSGRISATFRLQPFSNDMKVSWKATEMWVNLYEYLSCTDGTVMKHGCSKSIVPNEIRLMRCTETHAHVKPAAANRTGLCKVGKIRSTGAFAKQQI